MNTQSPNEYASVLVRTLTDADWGPVNNLIKQLRKTRGQGKQVFICGNGGSAANAIHLANDFLYGASNEKGKGIKVEALSANVSILTCLGNDISYDEIFSQQLIVKGNPGDLLLVLSGSGNSPNILRAVEVAIDLGLTTAAVLGFDGGHCKGIVQIPVHFPIQDMQISEDLQLVVGHICMKNLVKRD